MSTSAPQTWVHVLRTCNLPDDRPPDTVSKWLLISRACVFSMTLISVAIGGILAWLDGAFPIGTFALVVLGACLGHASNNMVNDLFDVQEGVDTEDYPRASYAPHPLLDSMVTRNQLIAAIAVCNVGDLAIALYLAWQVGPWIIAFAVAGLATSVFYAAPPLKLKHRGLGEPAIFLIWGPLITGGTYYAMSGTLPDGWTWLATVPYGLAVTIVLLGKHLDKADLDRAKGVRTLPVILGEKGTARWMQRCVWGFYVLVGALAVTDAFPLTALLVLLSVDAASRFVTTLSAPAPETPDEAYARAKAVIPRDLRGGFEPGQGGAQTPLWPLWFVAWGVWWVRLAGGSLVAGLLLGALVG